MRGRPETQWRELKHGVGRQQNHALNVAMRVSFLLGYCEEDISAQRRHRASTSTVPQTGASPEQTVSCSAQLLPVAHARLAHGDRRVVGQVEALAMQQEAPPLR